jgi:hypothetical protein
LNHRAISLLALSTLSEPWQTLRPICRHRSSRLRVSISRLRSWVIVGRDRGRLQAYRIRNNVGPLTGARRQAETGIWIIRSAHTAADGARGRAEGVGGTEHGWKW